MTQTSDYQNRVNAVLGTPPVTPAPQAETAAPPPVVGNLPPNASSIKPINASVGRSWTQYAVVATIACIGAYFLLGSQFNDLVTRLKPKPQQQAQAQAPAQAPRGRVDVTPDATPVTPTDTVPAPAKTTATIPIRPVADTSTATFRIPEVRPQASATEPVTVTPTLQITTDDIRFRGKLYIDPNSNVVTNSRPSVSQNSDGSQFIGTQRPVIESDTPPATSSATSSALQGRTTEPTGGSTSNQAGDSLRDRLAGGTMKFPATTAYTASNRRLSVLPGRSINCTLDDELDTSLPGLITCTVSRDVFSDDGSCVLVRAGATAVGEYRGRLENGQNRVFVVWTQLQSQGQLIDIDSPGTDGLGRAGVAGDVDRRFFQRYQGAVLVSVMQSASSRSNGNGQVLAQATQSAVGKALEQEANIPPLVQVPRSTVMTIRVAKIIKFPSCL